jgi:hypothetical protein
MNECNVCKESRVTLIFHTVLKITKYFEFDQRTSTPVHLRQSSLHCVLLYTADPTC